MNDFPPFFLPSFVKLSDFVVLYRTIRNGFYNAAAAIHQAKKAVRYQQGAPNLADANDTIIHSFIRY